MTEVVLVAMSLQDVAVRAELGELADHFAFLQLAEPSLTSVLTRLADRRVNEITLVGFSLAGQPPARSWLRRVASHWLREYGGERPALHLATELLASLDPVHLKEIAVLHGEPRTPRRH